MICFLADMPISPQTVQSLQRAGYEAVHVRDYRMQRAADAEILELARKEDRVILTMDLGFGTMLALSGTVCPGVIIFRLKSPKPQRVSALLISLLDSFPEREIIEHIVVVEEDRVRTRELPIWK